MINTVNMGTHTSGDNVNRVNSHLADSVNWENSHICEQGELTFVNTMNMGTVNWVYSHLADSVNWEKSHLETELGELIPG